MPTYGQTEVAANAALALIDSQKAALDKQGLELESLRFFASVFAQDHCDLMEAGAMREREEAIAELEGDLARWQGSWNAMNQAQARSKEGIRAHMAIWVLTNVIGRHRSRGPLLPPLPPEQLAAENVRLRTALTGLVGAHDGSDFRWLPAYEELIAEARKLLGEACR